MSARAAAPLLALLLVAAAVQGEDTGAVDFPDEDNEVLDPRKIVDLLGEEDYLDVLVGGGEDGKWLSLPGFGLFDNCINPPPECPNSNITFWLYTREIGDDPEQLDVAVPESIEYARWAHGKPVKVLIHGYTGDKDYSPNTEIRPAYLKYGDYNVISVDWSPLAPSPCYVQATYNVALVGNCTAQLIDEMVRLGVAAFEDIHVVGFSLGGQVAGNIANYIRSGKLTRITGLDPALPLFTTISTSPRLDASDAQFVDVIHTNAGWKGKLMPSGQLDFYLNSIIQQPGCSWDSSCDHARAPAYFAESIASPQGFWGFSCSSIISFYTGLCSPDDAAELVLMGEHANSSSRGVYFAYTNPTFPFAKGHDLGEAVESLHNATSQVGGALGETAFNATAGAAEAAGAGAAEAAAHRPTLHNDN
ncbi:pancreatic triacylglycerol lipase-like [Frankliniella occidentalis]|uniref:Pancreatic triacylglycerol lipase-like n=1 Tax=Frankliniella occidentalis TaxID=133901 RepID=A0A6J1S1I6_FRAOC|nr:pancreatic triacylglycerol lipase-like [Frankliniella occidentalis]XP_052123978.1 pancreatic triacylglycerol lipase-like [Frankliniella occidentalis]